ncbi:response regulator [Fulvimarina sp. MAC8]|uniref:response regulator n=1 Tax=Fulvimarina sp. MAC8 TaxID=3162874 RepID=UPI0032EDE45F
MKRILVIDDDPHIREIVVFALEREGYASEIAKDGREALERHESFRPDLVVLDIGLPEQDGLEVCRAIRRDHETPILFLSARSEEIDRVLGLEIGGDDYVTKPFSPRELVARVKTILKRSGAPAKAPNAVRHGVLSLDREARTVTVETQDAGLTGLEFSILTLLIERPRMVFSRNQLLDGAWPDNVHVSDRTIDSHIRNLRAKLARAGCPDAIDTVHGVGFRLGACGG